MAEEGLDDVSVAGEATIEPILTPTKLRFRGLNPLSQRALHSLGPPFFGSPAFNSHQQQLNGAITRLPEVMTNM